MCGHCREVFEGEQRDKIMKNIVISDEEEGIPFYAGMVVSESDLDALEKIWGRLFWKIQKLEKDAHTPWETRLNVIDHSLDTILKAQINTNELVKDAETKVVAISRRLDEMTAIHTRMCDAIDNNTDLVNKISVAHALDHLAAIKRDNRLSDIEEFLGDL